MALFNKDPDRAETLATMLAHSRASRTVEVADLLAGMYIYEWENLSKFWKQQDEIETFLLQICRISPQRWHHWIQFYDQRRLKDEPRRRWRLPTGFKPAKGKTGQPDANPLVRTTGVQKNLKTDARHFSPLALCGVCA